MWGKLIKQFFYKNEYSNLALRKTKSFNKSRYSRNRQYYRTGVYWCLWLNIILVFALYYVFYRYTFKFSYIFIFYIVSSILGLLAFFSKNYFLGFIKAVIQIFEPVVFNIILKFRTLDLKISTKWEHDVVMPYIMLRRRLLERPSLLYIYLTWHSFWIHASIYTGIFISFIITILLPW